MSDAQTDKADLLLRLASNGIGNVSSEDLRAFVNSVMGASGSFSWTGDKGTIPIGTTAVKLDGFDITGTEGGVTVNPATGEITVDPGGDGAWSFLVTLSVSLQNARGFIFRTAKNGVPGAVPYKVEGTGDPVILSFGGDATLAAGDVVSVYIEADQVNSDFTAHGGGLSISRNA